MAISYKKVKDSYGTEMKIIQKFEDGVFKWSIPFSEGNTDYQEYKSWVAAGNTPEAAD